MDITEFELRPECQNNLKLGNGNFMGLDYADYELTGQGIRRRRSPRYLYFKLRGDCMVSNKFHWIVTIFKIFEKTVAFIRSNWLSIVLLPILPLAFILAVILCIFSQSARDVIIPPSLEHEK